MAQSLQIYTPYLMLCPCLCKFSGILVVSASKQEKTRGNHDSWWIQTKHSLRQNIWFTCKVYGGCIKDLWGPASEHRERRIYIEVQKCELLSINKSEKVIQKIPGVPFQIGYWQTHHASHDVSAELSAYETGIDKKGLNSIGFKKVGVWILFVQMKREWAPTIDTPFKISLAELFQSNL